MTSGLIRCSEHADRGKDGDIKPEEATEEGNDLHDLQWANGMTMLINRWNERADEEDKNETENETSQSEKREGMGEGKCEGGMDGWMEESGGGKMWGCVI